MKTLVRVATIPLSLDVFCRGFLRELNEVYKVEAIASPGPLLEQIALREGVAVRGVEISRNIDPIGDLRAIKELTRIFSERKPDMVHSITPKAGLISMIAAKKAGVPLRVHTFTGLLFPAAKGPKRLILKAVDRMIAKNATHILAEGQGVRNDLKAVTDKDITVLGHGNVRGIDLNYYSRRSRQTPASPRGMSFLYVGRFNVDKGLRELVSAFNALSKKYKNIHLVMVGAGVDGEKPLPKKVLNIITTHPQIHIHRWKDDVRPYYEAANCLVLPSYREGFPNAVLEAGAMELPSIVTDINGSREIITEGVNGTIVPAHNTRALQNAMAKAIESPEQYAEMGKRARAVIAKRFELRYLRNCQKEYYANLFDQPQA